LVAPTLTAEPPPGGWTGRLVTDGKVVLIGPITLTARFPPPPFGNEEVCAWTAHRLRGTFNTEGPVHISTGQQFKLGQGSSNSCPKTATLTAHWALATTEHPHEKANRLFLD
jgi:hypothetical protein